MVLLRPDNTLCHNGYLLYALQSKAVQYEIRVNEGTGSTVSNLRIPLLEKLPIPIRSLPEQRAIANILGSLDDKIELNRRMNETLEGIARALFKSWFVDFDPVRAKMDGRQPAGMSPDIANLFPSEFEHVNGELVPKGWSLRSVSDVIEVNPTRRLPKGSIAPYLDMKNMPVHGHHPNEWTHREMGSGTKFINGDTLLARITPCLENGKTAFVDFLSDSETGWGSTEYIVLRPRPPLPVEFGYYLARSDEFRLHAITNMTGSSGRQRVPNDCLSQFAIAVPPATVAEAFEAVVRPIMLTIRANCGQSRTAAQLRDTLLPKLLSGELRVPEADKMLEKVL
jgi:type I restriction enzyme S subunit